MHASDTATICAICGSPPLHALTLFVISASFEAFEATAARRTAPKMKASLDIEADWNGVCVCDQGDLKLYKSNFSTGSD